MLHIKSLLKGSVISVLALMIIATPVSAKQRVHHHRQVLMSITIGGNQHRNNGSYRHRARHARHTYTRTYRIGRNHKNNRNYRVNRHKRSHRRLSHKQMVRLITNTINQLKKQKEQSRKVHVRKPHVHQSYAQIYERAHRSTSYNPREFRVEGNYLIPRNNKVVKNTLSQFNYWTLRDINKDRKSYHLWPLRETKQLNDLARIRASQIETNFNHRDSQGMTYDAKDASQVGMNPLIGQFMVSENIMGIPLGYSNEEDDPTNYYSRNGHDLADEDENSMLNYDNDDNGHRKNILDTTSHNVGIASQYDNKDKSFYLAEEFM